MTIREEERPDGVVELIIDAPPVNALTIADLRLLAEVLDSYSRRPQVNAVVLRGEGRGFAAGGDVKEVQRMEGHQGILGQASASLAATVALHECAVPVIAAVHAYCIGLGVLLAGSCDAVLCARDTKFVLAEVDNGAAGGAIQASGLMPDKRLRVAMFTCEPVAAEELRRYGSVYAVVDGADLQGAALDLAARIAAKPGRAVRAAKLALNASTGRRIRDRYRQELSYTYELNLLGDAAAAREQFVTGERPGYQV
ncbi:enoyl-CoA hydratase-related protein [Streptomyces sp. NPDC055722]